MHTLKSISWLDASDIAFSAFSARETSCFAQVGWVQKLGEVLDKTEEELTLAEAGWNHSHSVNQDCMNVVTDSDTLWL